ncbi:Gfo/Idh/MocA family protein [Fictibacillus terranigra]|uniref:Gfo/Idh/MocA family oxidoreductase n=1 Tax=Fictibacillus terranigra TaxID=3058424 RepID=A0ABT8EBQ3_9BACL|nr:Gfo/Idh/MocA family oxidoreductase [Fictibacillus sp. CENA-BCM004]MDN4075325.1 Gfo/Idh/MocA family oxidoreductase [Fictibacillus sp. CENA-BCM004]
MRVYIIGAGVIGRTHARAAYKIFPELELRAADLNPHALKGFCEEYPEAVAFNDVQEMLNSESPLDDDIVIVSTPPFAHFNPTKAALQSGRHVLCEKPLAMNLSQANEMVHIAEENKRLLGCCSVRFKGMPHMETVKEVLLSGALGEIYHVTFVNKRARSRSGIEYQAESPWFLDSAKSGGGVLMDWGPYDFATLLDILKPDNIDVSSAWIAKPATDADPDDKPFNVETHAGSMMTFYGSSQSVHIHYERASCAHGEEYVKVEIEGTSGSVRWTPFDSRQPVFLRYDRQGQAIEKEVETGPKSEFTIFDNPLLHFSRKVSGLKSYANVNQSALDHFHCIEAVYAAAKTGQKQTITLNRPEYVT